MKRFIFSLFLFMGILGVMSAAKPTVILNEDFAAFTEGSENAPAKTDIGGYSGKLAQTLKGWSGKNVFEAGGKLKVGDGGYLQTARKDMSANGGIVKVNARVRLISDNMGALKLMIGFADMQQFFLNDKAWHEVSFVATGGSTSSSVRIEPFLTLGGILIDNVKVETSPDFFPAPKALQPGTATGTSFVAVWKRIKTATHYLLDVYSKKGSELEYVLHDEQVKTTEKEVENLDPAKTYFFRVRATNGIATSDYSNEIQVVKVIESLAAPVATEASGVGPQAFTANWSAVDDAKAYQVNVYKKKATATAGPLVMLSENFDKITKGDLKYCEFGRPEEYLDEYTQLPGWYGKSHIFAKGYLGLYPFGDPSTVTTPMLNLSNDGGKLQVKAKLASYMYGQPQATDKLNVMLVDAKGNVLEDKSIEVAGDFKEYTIDFTKGTDNCGVRFSYNGSNKLFIDEMEIVQNVPAGYIVVEKLKQVETEGTSLAIEVDEPMSDMVTYAYTVQAIATTVDQGEIVDIFSPESNMIDVQDATGIDATVTAKQVVSVSYIDLTGKVSARPFGGLNIVVTTYSDGTTATSKMMK